MRTVNSSIGMHIQAVNKVLGIDRIYLKYRRNSDRFSKFPPDIIRTAGRKSNGQSQADIRAKVPSSRKTGVARRAFNAKKIPDLIPQRAAQPPENFLWQR